MAFIHIKNVFDCVRQTNPTQQAVLVALAFHCNKDDGRCFPSIKTLAEETRVNERTVRRILKELQRLGYVDWVSGGRTTGGKSVPNLYTLKLPSQPAEQADTECTSSRTLSAKQADTECTSSRAQCPTNHNITKKETSTQPKGVGVAAFVKMFEEYWTKYPAKHEQDEEEKCKDIYCEILAAQPDPQKFHKEILASLDVWRESQNWQTNNGQYIPTPQNWLKRRRWTVNPPPTKEWAERMYKESKVYNWALCHERCLNGTETGCSVGIKIPPDAEGHNPADYCPHYKARARDIEKENAPAIAALHGETTDAPMEEGKH